MVRQYQHFTYEDHYSVVDLSGSPDLEHIAAAYGMKFLRITDMENIDEQIDEVLSGNTSCLCECIIDPMDLV